MTTESIISLVVAIGALLFTALSFRRTAFQDNSTDAADRANMRADLRYIRDSVDDIKLEYKGIQKDVVKIREDIVKIDTAVQSAHKRLDRLEGHEHQ